MGENFQNFKKKISQHQKISTPKKILEIVYKNFHVNFHAFTIQSL